LEIKDKEKRAVPKKKKDYSADNDSDVSHDLEIEQKYDNRRSGRLSIKGQKSK